MVSGPTSRAIGRLVKKKKKKKVTKSRNLTLMGCSSSAGVYKRPLQT